MKKNITFIALFISLMAYAQTGTLQANAQPGMLDSTFGTNGKMLVTSLTDCKDVAAQQDNKILGIINSTLIRLNEDGTIDETFGDSGIALIDGGDECYFRESFTVLALPDGKILAEGWGYSVANPYAQCVCINRFLSNGIKDTTFGKNGEATYVFANGNIQTSLIPVSMILQPDGAILIGGTYTPDIESTDDALFVLRYDRNGNPDNSFGENGRILVDEFFFSVGGGYLGLQKDGKIVVGFSLGTATSGDSKPTLFRLLPDGSRDESFGKNGIHYSEFGKNDYNMGKIDIQSDDKIVGIGNQGSLFKHSVAIARYNADGSIDSSFGVNGIATTEIEGLISIAYDLIIFDNKITICGNVSINIFGDGLEFLTERYNSNGTLDSSFGDNGITITNFDDINVQDSYDQAYSMAQTTNGKFVLAGNSSSYSTGLYFALARYFGDPVKLPLITRIKRWIKHHILNWQDLQPNNNTAYYSIERSNNATANFTEIARINKSPAFGGTGEIGNAKSETYSYALSQTSNEKQTRNFYRIKAVDNDGSVAYSDVISETDNISAFTMYPNPVKDVLHVSGLKSSNTTTLTIVNSQGSIIKKSTVNAESYDFNVSKLKQGTYYLKVEEDNNSNTYQFIKE